MRFTTLVRNRTVRGALGMGAAFLAGLLVSGGAPFLAAPGRVAAIAPAPPLATGAAATSYADAVDRAAPSVVTIQVQKRLNNAPEANFPDDQFFQRFFGNGQGNGQAPRLRQMPAPIEQGLGSGVIVSPDGNILTNNHVVDDAPIVQVTLSDGREFPAKVVGTDRDSDLAVVHIDAKNLPALGLADSDKVRVGDVVLAIGNPLGVGETVTMGIISAKGRETDLSDNTSYENFLQTDAPINEGNSGGALITASGELIGINSQIMSTSGGNIGIGFAIPSDMAKNVLTQLVTTGHVRRGLLGVEVQSINSDLAQSLNLSSVHGAIVNDVTADGPAAQAGIAQGDVILKLNGTAIDDSNDLRNRVSSMMPGTTVTLDLDRKGTMKTVTARLGEVQEQSQTSTGASERSGGNLGFTAVPVTPDLSQRFNLPRNATGLVVTNVDQMSAAARAGLQPGDVIRTVNGVPMHASSDLTRALESRTDRPSLAYVQRGDNMFYVALPIHP